MNIFRTGYIVAVINDYKLFSYTPWPLSDIENDEKAETLTDEADDRWFLAYDMLEVAPDFDYAVRYNNYCHSIGIKTTVLLIESPYNYFDIQINALINMVFGYDCIGTIGYSYLDNDRDLFEKQLNSKGIVLNQYGLFDSVESVEEFAKMRTDFIAKGNNIENYWDMIPIRISAINV